MTWEIKWISTSEILRHSLQSVTEKYLKIYILNYLSVTGYKQCCALSRNIGAMLGRLPRRHASIGPESVALIGVVISAS